MLHITLAVTVDGLPLGLLDQRFIERKKLQGENAAEKRNLWHCNEAIEHKESRRWIDVIRACHALDFGNCRTVVSAGVKPRVIAAVLLLTCVRCLRTVLPPDPGVVAGSRCQ